MAQNFRYSVSTLSWMYFLFCVLPFGTGILFLSYNLQYIPSFRNHLLPSCSYAVLMLYHNFSYRRTCM